MLTLHHLDPIADALVAAIQVGPFEALTRLLAEHPELASARIEDDQAESRTTLHLATAWPGYFANGPAVVTALIAAGADVNARLRGSTFAETPLHWVASNDDVDVAVALIDGGADLEATGASIAGGTPLDNAVGYGCWRVARLLVERGARVDKLWHAAALGMLARVEAIVTEEMLPAADILNGAFWQACHGGQRRTAEYLLARGADPNWIPPYAKQTSLDVAAAADTGRKTLVAWLRDRGARSHGPLA
jgi:ankyrin repeat protein